MKRKRTLRSNGQTPAAAAEVLDAKSTVSKRTKPISKVIDGPSSESPSPKKRKRRRKNYYNVTSQSAKAKAAAKIKQQKLAKELSSLNAQQGSGKSMGDERQSTNFMEQSSSSSLKRAVGDIYIHKKFKRPLNTNLLSSSSNSEPVSSPSSTSHSVQVTSNSNSVNSNEKNSNFSPVSNVLPFNGLRNNDEIEHTTSNCKKNLWKPKFHAEEHEQQQQHDIMNGNYNSNSSNNIDDNVVKEKLRQSVNERINQIIYRNESILSQNNFSTNNNTTVSTIATITDCIPNNKNLSSSSTDLNKLSSYSTINRLSLMSGGSVANESNNKIINSSISLPSSSIVSLAPLSSHNLSLASSALLLSSSSVIQSQNQPYSGINNTSSMNQSANRFSGGEMLIKEKTTRIVPEYLGTTKYRNPSNMLPFFGSENIKHFTASTSTYRGSPYIETKSRQDLDSIKPLQLVVKKEKIENSTLNATCNSWLDKSMSMSNNVFQPVNGIIKASNYPMNFSTTSSFYTKPTISTTILQSTSSINNGYQDDFAPKTNPSIAISIPLPTISTSTNIPDEASQSSTSTNNSHCSVVQSRSSSLSGEKGFIVLESNNDQDFTYVRGRGRGKYVCESCGIRCKKPSMLRKHIKTHTDLRPFTCSLCNFSFKTKGNLTKHQKSKSHHKKVLKTNVKKNLNKSIGDIESSNGNDEKSNLCEDLSIGSMKKSFSEVDDEDENEMDDEDDDEDTNDSETETDSDDNSNNNIIGDGSEQNRDEIAQSLLDLSTSIRSTSANTNINTTITTTTSTTANNINECPLDFSIKKSSSNSIITPQKLEPKPQPANVKLHQPWLLDDQNQNNSEESFSSRNSIIVTPSKESPEIKSDNLVNKNSNDVKINLNSVNDLIETTQIYNKSPIKNIINNLTININGPSTSNGPIQGTSSSNLIRIAPQAQQAEFRQPNILQQEIDGKLECNICGKKNFNRPSQLTLHMNIHCLERPFRCDCGVSFKTKGHLIKHRRSSAHDCKLYLTGALGVANEDNPRPFKCPDCKIAFRIHGHLAKHLRSKMHIMRMECLGKLPFGIYFEMETAGASLNEIDTTDCEMSLISLQILAQKLYGDNWRERLCARPEEPNDNGSGSGSS